MTADAPQKYKKHCNGVKKTCKNKLFAKFPRLTKTMRLHFCTAHFLLQFAFCRLIKTAGKRRATTQKHIDKHTLQEGAKKTLTAKINVFFSEFTDKP